MIESGSYDVLGHLQRTRAPESVYLSMILGNALGRSLSPSSNSSRCICFTDPCGSRRKPSADKRTLRPGTSKFAQLRRLPGITVEKRDCGDRIRHFNSGDVKGTIRSVVRCLLVSIDVRRHRLISINYISLLPCHGRGRGFESRRPRHFDSIALHIATFLSKIELNLTHDTTPQTRTK